ncbi:MAG: VWA domain-containing protein [Candidatus Acidiferrales bacterium]
MKVDVTVVSLYCTVKDQQGRLATNLQASDFEVHEDGRRQQVRYFSRESDRPLSLALLVDTSPSQKEVLPAEKEMAAQFLKHVLRPTDQAMVMAFDANVDLWQDLTPELPRLQWALNRLKVNASRRLKPGEKAPAKAGATRLYDAIHEAATQKLARSGERRVIILLSDGVDSGSRMTEKQALEAAQRADAIVYAIRFSDPAFYWRAANRPGGGDEVLQRLTKETGGRVLMPQDTKRLGEAFDHIASELRSQYSLGYTPANAARDGRFRRVHVRVKRDGHRVQARSGYYAPRP